MTAVHMSKMWHLALGTYNNLEHRPLFKTYSLDHHMDKFDASKNISTVLNGKHIEFNFKSISTRTIIKHNFSDVVMNFLNKAYYHLYYYVSIHTSCSPNVQYIF